MIRTLSAYSNPVAIRKTSYHSELRQLSALVLLVSFICAPVSAIAQTKEQEKRGITVPSAPKPSATSMTSGNPGS